VRTENNISVIKVDAHGNFVRDTMCVKEALLEVLRFTRKHPRSTCTIELREFQSQFTLEMQTTPLRPADAQPGQGRGPGSNES
jgi:hypothetical protein